MTKKRARQRQERLLLQGGDYLSIRQMLERINEYIPDKRILADVGPGRQIRYVTAAEVYEEVMCLGDGLIAAGLKDAHIAIVSENSIRYLLADICVNSGVGVVAPLDAHAPQELLNLLLQKCDATAVFCGTEFLKNIRAAQKVCPALQTIITLDKKADGALYYEDLVETGRSLSGNSVYRKLELDLDAPAKILFTSGTTGPNKGVVFSSRNLAANMLNCMAIIASADADTSMSVLPMHHAIEINTHIMACMGLGRLMYINENMRNMMVNIKLFKPEVITVVPVIANAFYRNITIKAAKAGKTKKLARGIRISNFLRKLGLDLTHTLFADVHAVFGGNLKIIICGGAMLNPAVNKGLNNLGIKVINGYGITECGPLISINDHTKHDRKSVGLPCPSLDVRLDNVDENGIGELCVKGASVAKGYYKDPQATAEVFSTDGFFNTGDSARIDRRGRICLLGRKKNTIVLPNGKTVCPEEVENIIESSLNYVRDVVVYSARLTQGGAFREILCAGLYIDDENIRKDRSRIAADLAAVNSRLPVYKQVEYAELPNHEYAKSATRKILRNTLPDTCSGKGMPI